ncbi:hypothetical protein Y1Q_0016653 [Alligator mississippiensis]|uniref:Uncharacterized protein n=1 Tax=Alligator mississippiensis TaxID=8496 RepID=A0A151P1C5_ALLMI|nr:hypothetical protein Y1Q_0016653 [Alligator mississippiensis]
MSLLQPVPETSVHASLPLSWPSDALDASSGCQRVDLTQGRGCCSLRQEVSRAQCSLCQLVRVPRRRRRKETDHRATRCTDAPLPNALVLQSKAPCCGLFLGASAGPSWTRCSRAAVQHPQRSWGESSHCCGLSVLS